jgi:YopX protein
MPARSINFRIRFSNQFYYIGDLNEIFTFNLNLRNENGFIPVWQQSSELKDKVGKTIYEGDIVRYTIGKIEYLYEIKFGPYKLDTYSGCGFYLDLIDDKHYLPSPLRDESYRYLEVVGNIFDNKELMEKRKNKTIIT